MLFSLEALEARKGDCLIVHYGKTEAPRFVVIDGGPEGVYAGSLKPRLEQLSEKWMDEDDQQLNIEMLMVSHIDDDHINGVLDWMGDLDETEHIPYNIRTLWHNSFDEVLGNGSEELRSKLASVASSNDLSLFNGDPESARHSAAVVASVKQGRQLRAHAKRLGIRTNRGFTGLVMAQDNGPTTVTLPDGLKLHVLCPTRDLLADLHAEWEKNIRNNPNLASVAAFSDRSVANLSSIVVVAEFGKGTSARRMLLTGDARGDHVLKGLQRAGFLTNSGPVHFDVLKMPHHGSNRNMTQGFLEQVTADHYVISANGEHDNPDPEIFTWIANARQADSYTVHLTNADMVNPKNGNDVRALMDAALSATRSKAPNRHVAFRARQDLSVCIDLLDAVDY